MPDTPTTRPELLRLMAFDQTKQCHWCGNTNLDSTVGYGGERQCLTCGWGGDGEPDVPCMFYKITAMLVAGPFREG